ncbi:MAG: MaoC/PaaZ C-terminal domain-containing protein [Rhizobiaceae bacterium]
MQGLSFESLEVGRSYETAGATITEDAIIRFGLEWDPQPFHIDRLSAAESLFGRLVGSGLHTLLMTYRLYVDHGLLRGTALAGLGIDNIRFIKPLCPGDTIHVLITIVSKGPSRTPGQGIVRLKLETSNHHRDAILSMDLKALVASGDATLPSP